MEQKPQEWEESVPATHRLPLLPACITGLLGAGLGIATGVLMAGEQKPPYLIFITSTYQNTAVAVGAVLGFCIGALALLYFLARAHRTQFFEATGSGAKLGAAAGAAIGLVTASTVYAIAGLFDYKRTGVLQFLLDNLGYAFMCGVAGLILGFLAVEIWGKRLRYRD